MLPSQLKLLWPSGAISTDEGTLPIFAVTADAVDGSAFSWSDVSGLDRTYAIGYFDENTATPELQGWLFAIYSATSSSIVPVQDLPAAPVVGDQFYLIQGIRFSSNQRMFLNQVNGAHPELTAVSCHKITGIIVTAVRSQTDLYLYYDSDAKSLAVSSDKANWGSGLDLNFDVTDGYLQAPDGQWILVDVDSSELPSDSEMERVLVSSVFGSWVPPTWMDSNNENVILHHFAVLKNDSSDSVNIILQDTRSIDVPRLAEEYTAGDLTLELTISDGQRIPAKDFWFYIYDASTPDLVYVRQRFGTTCHLEDTTGWQRLEFSNGQAAAIGSVITDGIETGVLRAVYLTSGTLTGGDATGEMILSGSTGLFSNGSTISINGGAPLAEASSDGEYNLRGFARAASWPVGTFVWPYPEFDSVFLDPDSDEEFEKTDGPQTPVNVGGSIYDTPQWTWSGGVWQAAGSLSGFSSGAKKGIIMTSYLIGDRDGNLNLNESLTFDWST